MRQKPWQTAPQGCGGGKLWHRSLYGLTWLTFVLTGSEFICSRQKPFSGNFVSHLQDGHHFPVCGRLLLSTNTSAYTLMKLTLALLALASLSAVPCTFAQKAKPAAPAKEAAAEPAAPAPRKLTAAESKAFDAYKTEMLAIQKWLTTERDDSHANEIKAHRIPVNLAARLEKVPVKGLPENLATAFAAYKKNYAAAAALLKDMPKDDAAAMEWMANKVADNKYIAARAELDNLQLELDSALLAAAADCGGGIESDLFMTSELAQIKDRWVVILGAYKKFEEAKTDGQKAAKDAKLPFSLHGMIYDKKGLRLPDDHEDELYAGQYVMRSSNYCSEGEKEMENHVSVELSSSYEGFAPDYYITVGYIAETAEEAEKKAAEFKKFAPGTYVKKTKIFMGCDR
jgi:hypothetical protein